MTMTKTPGNQRGACLSLACFGFAVVYVAPPLAEARAMTVYEAAAVVGQWDMSFGDTNRTCRMTFEARTSADPAGCRLSLPILAKVGAWNVPQAGDIDRADAS